MILAFAHPKIVVGDLEKVIDFYGKMFGFTVIGNEVWEFSELSCRMWPAIMPNGSYS